MMRLHRRLVKLVVLLVFVAAITALAAEKKTPGPPAATVSMVVTSLALGPGIEWGDGMLTLADGTQRRFALKGLLVGSAGVAKATSHGQVYHLNKIEDFAGRYVAAEAAFTMMGGKGGLVMRNQHGVTMYLNTVEQGVEITLGIEGAIITFTK